MLRIVLLASLLLVGGVAAVPPASAEIDLYQLCQGLGPCRPIAGTGCWISDLSPPELTCRA